MRAAVQAQIEKTQRMQTEKMQRQCGRRRAPHGQASFHQQQCRPASRQVLLRRAREAWQESSDLLHPQDTIESEIGINQGSLVLRQEESDATVVTSTIQQD